MGLIKELSKTDSLIRRHRPPHKAGTPILKVEGLGLRFDQTSALENISFQLAVGERLALVGPNGAGKSTLLKVIAGVLKPSEGQVNIYGQEPGGHICIAYLPQRSQVDWNFPVNVTDVVMMGRIGKMGLFRNPSAEDRKVVAEALEVVNLTALAKRQIRHLSGGQQQRMFIARALAQEAELMLMDEPLNGLDLPNQEDIFTILDRLRARAVTVVVALHDLKIAAERFDRVMLLNRQVIGLGPPNEVFAPTALLQAYGGHMRLLPLQEGVMALSDTCCDEGEHGGD